MGILILGVILIPFLTSLFLKVIGKFLNELLTNFITLNAAMLSVATSFFLFGYIFFDKFKPLKFELFQWFPNPEINFEFYLDGLSGVMMVLICGLSLVIQLFSTSYMSKDEEFGEFWKLIHEEYLLTKKMLLKISNFKNLMENEPANKLSIETREEIVMPLITIQQYALQIVNEIDSNKLDNSKKPIFEKMITRSLYGNINASRNSA